MTYAISYDRRARQQAATPSGTESRLAADPWACTRAAGYLKEVRHMEFTAGGPVTLTIQVQTRTVVIVDIAYVG